MKWDSQWHSCLWHHSPCWAAEFCQNSGLCGPQASQRYTGTPSVWVSGGAGQGWQNPCNANPGEGWLHLRLCLGSAAKCCTFLWLYWLQVSVGSELQVCSCALALLLHGLQRCHKAAWCVTAWNISHLEHCCYFPLYFFFHAHSSPWLKVRQTFNCKNKNVFSSHFSKFLPSPNPNQCITLYNTD